eukprot:6126861-Pyramimonas_sp.AAC.1
MGSAGSERLHLDARLGSHMATPVESEARPEAASPVRATGEAGVLVAGQDDYDDDSEGDYSFLSSEAEAGTLAELGEADLSEGQLEAFLASRETTKKRSWKENKDLERAARKDQQFFSPETKVLEGWGRSSALARQHHDDSRPARD